MLNMKEPTEIRDQVLFPLNKINKSTQNKDTLLNEIKDRKSRFF